MCKTKRFKTPSPGLVPIYFRLILFYRIDSVSDIIVFINNFDNILYYSYNITIYYVIYLKKNVKNLKKSL